MRVGPAYVKDGWTYEGQFLGSSQFSRALRGVDPNHIISSFDSTLADVFGLSGDGPVGHGARLPTLGTFQKLLA